MARKPRQQIKPTKAWAALWLVGASGRQREEICQVEFYKDQLQSNLRKIPVQIVPVERKR